MKSTKRKSTTRLLYVTATLSVLAFSACGTNDDGAPQSQTSVLEADRPVADDGEFGPPQVSELSFPELEISGAPQAFELSFPVLEIGGTVTELEAE